MPNKVQTVKQLQEHEKENTETAVAVVVTMMTMKTEMKIDGDHYNEIKNSDKIW